MMQFFPIQVSGIYDLVSLTCNQVILRVILACTVATDKKEKIHFLRGLIYLINLLFHIIWLIIGSIMIFPAWQKYKSDDWEWNKSCNQAAFIVAFIMIIVYCIAIPIICLYCILTSLVTILTKISSQPLPA